MELSHNVLNRRVFKQKILDNHIKNFMLGKTQRFLSKKLNTIDVGAAVGMYTSFFAKYSNHVFAFEAVPPVYDQLKRVEEKKKNITAYNNAVSDKVGTFKFYVDDKRLSNSGFQNLVDGIPIDVESVTIDSMTFSNVGFIKIDTEGTELDVLNGAIETIDRNRPSCMVEIYYKFNKQPVSLTFDFFFDRKYRCFYNEKNNQKLHEVHDVAHGVEVSSSEEMLSIHDGDFLFIPEEIYDFS